MTKLTCKRTYLGLLLCLPLIWHSAYATPDLLLEGLDGKHHNLNEYIGKGQWAVVNIWGVDCPPCRLEMPELVKFHINHKDSDATVLGIAIEFPSFGYANKAKVQTFVNDHEVKFPILLSDSDVTVNMGAGYLEGLPASYLYSPKGKLMGYEVGAITAEIIENFIKNQAIDKKSQ